MQIRDLTIPATDGYQLAATLFEPAQNVSNVVLIASATGIKRSFYEKYARYLSSQQFTVITFDYRGIGDSRPITLNKFNARMHDWGEKDIAGMIQWLSQEYPQKSLSVIGHSVAGQVMGLAHNIEQVSAMIFVGSQSGYWKLWPFPAKLSVLILWYLVIPFFAMLFAYFPSRFLGLGENLPAGVALEWASWGRDPNYILGENNLTSKANFKKYSKKILLYSVEDDFFAPRRAVERLLTFYPNAEKIHKHVTAKDLNKKSIGHFGFFREKVGSVLWPETVKWLKQEVKSDLMLK